MPQYTVAGTAEQALTLAAVTGRVGHLLIATCTGPSEIQDQPPFCAPIFDSWDLHARYEAACVGHLDRLNLSLLKTTLP